MTSSGRTMDRGNADPRRWLALAGGTLAFMFTMIGTTMPTPLYPIYERVSGFSQLMITIIFAVYALGVIMALLVTKSWSEQIGRRPVLIGGLACAIASDIVFALSTDLWPVLLARLLSGFSAGVFTGTATVAVIEWAPEGRKQEGTFAATAANMGGLGLGAVFAGALAVALPHPLLLPYLIHVAMAVLAVLFIWAAPEQVERAESPSFALQKAAVPREAMSAFIPASIAALAAFMICGFLGAVAPSVLGTLMGYHNNLLIGFVAGLIFLGSNIGQIAMTRIREDLRLMVGCWSLLAGAIIITASLAALVLIPLCLGIMIAGVGHGIAFRAGMTSIIEASPEEKEAQTVSMFFVVAYVAISVPIIAIGFTSRALGLYPSAIAFGAIVVALTALAIGLLWWRKRN